MKRTLTLAAATSLALGIMGGPALAHHQHYIETPQGQRITLPCEPDGTAAADRHPLHWRLHIGPSQAHRAIDIHHYGENTCGEAIRPGPTGDGH